MYLMIGLRPNIGFVVVKLAQQMINPSNNHYRVGLHLCRYLLATCRYRLVYNGLSNESLVAYSDSDWGQDHEHRKSTTGYFTMLAQGITSWLSCKQKSVALSSTEAEYMVLSDCSCQLIWTSNLLSEIGFDIPVSHLYGDNLGSLFWSTNPVQEKRSKHIDIVTNFIWSYLHQFFDDSHGLKASLKPLKRPFDRYQSCLEVINNGQDIKQINW